MAALHEENLPIARPDEPTREVKLLSDHRRNLVCERKQCACSAAGFPTGDFMPAPKQICNRKPFTGNTFSGGVT